MPDKTRRLQLPAPQGRALLTWEGKRPLRRVSVEPATLIETFQPDGSSRRRVTDLCADFPCADASAVLFQGDNKAVLARLLADGWRGRVKLVYIDPPFDTGNDFFRRVALRGRHSRRSLNGADGALGRQVQYADSWAADSYLQFMYERLILLRELLAENGSIWLHCDYRRVHYLRLLLEEVFGAPNYLNTISWRSQTARGAKVNAFYFPYSTQYIEIFARNRAAPTTWNPVRRRITLSESEAAASYMRDACGYFRTSDPGAYSFESLCRLHEQGRVYAPYGGEVVVDRTHRRVYASEGGNIAVKYYLKPLARGRYAVERAVDNLWDDIPGLGTTPGEDLGYPTQKTEALLRRIIAVATDPGDVVLDCFSGSGTTAAVAQQMGRRSIACDVNRIAVQTTAMRLYRAVPKPTVSVYRAGVIDAIRGPDAQADADVVIERRAGGGQATAHIIVRDYRSTELNVRLQAARRPPAHSPTGADGWRAAVDSIMIDTDYDGQVLNIALSDAPRRRRDLVSGAYELPISAEAATVAVRITDILGAETLVTSRI